MEREVVYLLMKNDNSYLADSDPEDNTQTVAVIKNDRLYQNIFSDNLMPQSTYAIEINIDLEFYPVHFRNDNYITLACDINHSYLSYTNINYAEMKNFQWNKYNKKLMITRADGIPSEVENCMILYFYNHQETFFYLRNCKVKAKYFYLNHED